MPTTAAKTATQANPLQSVSAKLDQTAEMVVNRLSEFYVLNSQQDAALVHAIRSCIAQNASLFPELEPSFLVPSDGMHFVLRPSL